LKDIDGYFFVAWLATPSIFAKRAQSFTARYESGGSKMYYYWYHWNGPGIFAAFLTIVAWVSFAGVASEGFGWLFPIAIISFWPPGTLVGSLVGFVYDRLPRGRHLSSYVRAFESPKMPPGGRVAMCWAMPAVVMPFVSSVLCLLGAIGFALFGEITWQTAMEVAVCPGITLVVASVVVFATYPLRTLSDEMVAMHEEQHFEVDGLVCPRCGFGYGWNGACCGHCGHGAAP
jgi:hypothetical protein